jgi:predicted TIM-barrel fold metal-dependent hydrolase
MMIVDTHCHPFFGNMIENEDAFRLMIPMLTNCAAKMGETVDADTLVKRAKEITCDRTGESMIESMNEAGIDVAVLLMVEGPVPTDDDENKIAGQIARNHPDRILALAGMDPRNQEAPDQLRRCFEEYGCRGLKYHADFGFDPGSPESYKLLEIVAANDGILVSHTGPLGGIMRSSMADVSRLADVLVDFPQLPVVAAHVGLYNWRPWASLAAFHDNLYGDLSMWDLIAFGNYPFFCRELRDLIDCAGISKITFGTDDPFQIILRPTRDWVGMIQSLPQDAPEGVEFSEEEVTAILGGNAAQLLGLREEGVTRRN